MAHFSKFTRGSLGHMLGHYSRDKENLPDNIKPEMTGQNYNLAGEYQPLSQLDFIHKRLSEVKLQKRADVKVLGDWVVTAPKDLPREELRKFFEETHSFLANKYGRENVVSAYVHMDETEPHLHFAFIPVVPNKGKNRKFDFKVCVKECVSLQELKQFHPALQAHLEKALGHSVSVLNGATQEGNKSIAELKRGTAIEEMEKSRQKAAEIVHKAEKEAGAILDSLKPIEAEYRAKQAYVKAMSKEWDLTQAKENKSITGKVKSYTVPADVWETQQITRMDALAFEKGRQAWQKEMQVAARTPVMQENVALKKQVRDLQKEVKELTRKASAHGIEFYMTKKENEDLKGKLREQESDFIERLNKVLQELPSSIAEQFVKTWEAHQHQSRKKERGFEMEL